MNNSISGFRVINGFSRICLYNPQIKSIFLFKNSMFRVKRRKEQNILVLSDSCKFTNHIFEDKKYIHIDNCQLIFETPSTINNVFIDINKITLENFNMLISKFEELLCEAITVVFSFIEKNTKAYIKTLAESSILYIDVFFNCLISDEIISDYRNFYYDRKTLRFFTNSDDNININNSEISESGQAKIRNVKYFSADYCGCVSKSLLIYNWMHFCESQSCNTCLNRKLCIDKDGFIKNCPNMKYHYGNISNTNIEDVVNLPEFQKWWHIKKDEIDVCKDCEFRHMCTDCRAFLKDPENIYSQPAKCTYNPYICKWEGEEGYLPVEQCGTYSRETGFVPDKKKIKKLNKAIWGDE